MNKKVSFLLIFSFLFLSASPQIAGSIHPENERSGLGMRLIELGEGNYLPQPGDEITLNLSVFLENDSMVFTGKIHFIFHPHSSEDTLFDQILQLNEGDSASFSAHRSYVKNCSPLKEIFRDDSLSEFLRLEMKVSDITASAEIADRHLLMKRMKMDMFEAEKEEISNYLNRHQINSTPEANGMYFIYHNPGNGPPVAKGRLVKIRYTGLFLNGKAFDTSAGSREGMTLNYGTQLFLLEGLNYAIGRMREGSKALVLLPSSLAFGESGSVLNIVPPNTPVLYEVEVLKIH